MAIADGIYKVVSFLDTEACLDIQGASQSSGANCQLYRNNDTNAQKYKVVTSGGVTTFTVLSSGKRLDVSRGVAAIGNNVQQWEINGTRAQGWTLVDSTTKVIDGVTYTSQVIKSNTGSNFAMDATNAQTANNTNVQIYTVNGTDAQKWIFIPTTMYDSTLPVISGLGINTSITTPQTVIGMDATAAFYAIWNVSNHTCEYRYRWRGRQNGSFGAYNSFSAWNQATTVQGTLQYGSTTIPLTMSPYDKIELDIEVRAYNQNGSSLYGVTHGGSNLITMSVCTIAHVTSSGVTFGPFGLLLDYASSFQTNGNKLSLTGTIDGVQLFTHEETSLAYSGELTIGMDELSVIPSAGDKLVVSYAITTIDASFGGTFTDEIAYATSHGITISPTFIPPVEANGYTDAVTLSATYTSESVWLEIDQDGGTRFYLATKYNGSHHVLPPINKAYRIYIFVKDSSGNWGSLMVDRPSVYCPIFIWTYPGDYAYLRFGVGGNSTVDWTVKRNSNTVSPNGGRFEITSFKQSSTRGISVSGGIKKDDDAHSNFTQFEYLAMANYAIFRTPFGDWIYVAILSIKTSAEVSEYRKLDISMEEQEWTGGTSQQG